MKLGTIVITLFLILIIVGGLIFYVKFEKPKHDTANAFTNITIFSYEGNNVVKTGYNIYVNGNLYNTGETMDKGGIFEVIPLNSTVNVTNYNLEGQDYYSYSVSKQVIDNNSISRFNLQLTKPGVLKIETEGQLGLDDRLNLSISSEGFYEDLILCYEWSYRFIRVTTNETFKEIDKIEGYDKCFYTNITIDNSDVTIPLYPVKWGMVDKDEFIKIGLSDNLNNGVDYEYYIKPEYEIINNI